MKKETTLFVGGRVKSNWHDLFLVLYVIYL